MPGEIEDLLSEMFAIFPDRPKAVLQPQMKPPTPTHETLNPPLAIAIKDRYLCGNYRHILANSGDQIVVFAWTSNRTEAIAYNSRNKTVGRVPTSLLEYGGSNPFTDTKLYMTKSDQSRDSLGHVKWKAGDYVRVWNREDKKHSQSAGFCFNIATGGIGKFDTTSFSLILID